MTSTAQDRHAAFRLALEERFELHTDQLVKLTTAILSEGEQAGDLDRDTVTAMIAASRQVLADVTEALQRMAEGTYGSCEGCLADIPVERLAVLPHARFCVHCQQERDA
jgi:DnaK suppressor protein